MTSRTLHFPPGETTAKLLILGGRPPNQWADPQGSVELAEGMTAQLQLSSRDVGLLSLLEPGDLEALSVSDPSPGLAGLVNSLAVTRLTLSGVCAPGVMAELAGLDSLVDLTFEDATLDGESVERLAAMSQLRFLRFGGAATAAMAAAACRLTGLTSLIFNVSSGVAGGLEAIGDLTALTRLILGVPDVDDTIIPRLVALRELQMLYVAGTDFRGHGIEVLTGLPTLSTLAITGPAFELETLLGLRESPSLTTLIIRGLTELDDRDAPLLTMISPPFQEIRLYIDRGDDSPAFSLSTQVWLVRAKPELVVNQFSLSEAATDKYVTAGLGVHPRTGGLELVP